MFGHSSAMRCFVRLRVGCATWPLLLFIARLGGDEFTILVSDTVSPAGLQALSERLINTVTLPYNVDGARSESAYHRHCCIPGRRSRCHFSYEQRRRRALSCPRLRARRLPLLRCGDGSQPAGAPRVSARHPACHRSRRIPSALSAASADVWRNRRFEALLRWQHPERGNIPPADFIPIAEECGLIIRLANG